MALASMVVCDVVGVVIWMWAAATVAAVAVTLALVAACAAVLCRSVLQLMEDGATTTAVRPVGSMGVLPTVEAPARAQARPRPRVVPTV